MRRLIEEGLEEPSEFGFYLISNKNGDVIQSTWHFDEDLADQGQWADHWGGRISWKKLIFLYTNVSSEELYIESINAHDARMRDEGRRAEPTQDEIEMAAHSIWFHEHRNFSTNPDDVVALCNESFTLPTVRDEYIERAKNVLYAVREVFVR